MSKHTPGPWKVTVGHTKKWFWVETADKGEFIADCAYMDTSKANAHLIAAAPDLLMVCNDLIDANQHVKDLSLDRDEPHRGMIWGEARSILDAVKLKAKAVIKKAEGGE